MFTGLIEDVGTIGDLRLQQKSAVLTVKTNLPVRSMARGASVAVNGACLTVVKKGPSRLLWTSRRKLCSAPAWKL